MQVPLQAQPSHQHGDTGQPSFLDRTNSLLYYVQEGALYSRSSVAPDLPPTLIHTNPLAPPKYRSQNQPIIPRFLPDTNSETMVSPNGFYLINKSDKEEVIMANVSYEKGIHLWEFYCPLSLYGVGLGVTRKENNKWTPQLFSFTASTHRSVYLKLDMNENKLFAWVNKQKEHVIQLPLGEEKSAWTPCVSLKGKGNVVIFNPFSVDHLGTVSIHNPFNTNKLPAEIPSIPSTPAKENKKQTDLKILKINENKMVIYNSVCFKVIARNTKTDQFDFDWFQTPENQESPIEITFTHQELDNLNKYLLTFNYSPLSTERKLQDNSLVIESSLKNWFSYLRFLIGSFDRNLASIDLYQIILSKLERLRGYLHLMDQYLQPLLYSSYNILARWKSENQENHFSQPQYQLNVPLHQYSNYLPPATVHELSSINISKQYLIVATTTQILVYNIEIIPTLVLKSDLLTFIKSIETQSPRETTAKEEGLQIYQILNKCINLTQEVLPPKKVDLNEKYLNTLVNVFKYPQDISRKALIKTRNESIEDAVAWIELNKLEKQIIERKKSEFIEDMAGDSRILSVQIVESDRTLSPVVIALQTVSEIRVYWLSVDNEQVQKLYFKEEKGVVSFINFQYLKSIKDIKREDVGVNNILFKKDPTPNYLKVERVFTVGIDNLFKDFKLVQRKGVINLLVLNKEISTYEVNLDTGSLVKSSTTEITQETKITLKQENHPLTRSLEFTFEISKSSESHPEPQVLPSLEPSSSFLPLLVQSGPPGCNMNYPICSILYPSAKFLSNYPFTIVFEHLHGKYVKINSVVIERIGKRKGAQVKQGLIWTSNEAKDSSNPSQKQAYRFKFGTEEKKLVLRIDETEFRRYLFIMPIYDEKKNVNLPFEIGFVGVTGEAAEESSFTTNTKQLIKCKQINQLITLKSSGNPLTLGDEAVFTVINDKQVTLRIPYAKNTQAQISKPWRLVKQRQLQQPTLAKPKQQVTPSENVVQEIIQLQNNHNFPLLKALVNIDLSTQKEQTVLKLLRVLETYPSSPEKKSVLYQIAFGPHSHKVKEYYSSLLSSQERVLRIDILDLIFYHKLYNPSIIEPLINQTIENIKNSQNPGYKSLREAGNNHLLLESDFYSNYYYNLVEGERASETSKIYDKESLPVNIAIISVRFLKTMVIDLKSLVSVDHLLLSFQKSELKTKMRIRVYDSNKNILFGNFYQDNTWIQLTKNAYTKEMKELFSNPVTSGLNSLGINLRSVETRYLIVEISYTVLPIIGEAVEIANLPRNQIVAEVYGSVIGQAEEVSALSTFLNPNPQLTHEISSLNINGISDYSRFSTSINNFDYHVYRNVKNVYEQKTVEDIRLSYDIKLDNKDYTGCSSLLKQLIHKSSGTQPGLDYYYTLLIKLLDQKAPLTKETQTKLFNKIALTEKGPLQIKAIKSLLADPEFYEKSLSLLDDSTLKLFTEEKLKQKEIRSYIKNTLAKEQLSIKTVQLLIYLLRTNPEVRTEDWLEEIIILSQKTSQHKQCFKLLEKAHWIEIQSAKKYLIYLAKHQEKLYFELSSKLNVEDLIRFSLDLIKHNEVEIGIRTIQSIKATLPAIENEKVVNETLKSVIGLLSKSVYSEQILFIVEKLIENPRFKDSVLVAEAYLGSSEYLQLSFEKILLQVLEKQPLKVQQFILNAFLKTHLAPSSTSKLYLRILSSKTKTLDQKSLESLLELSGKYLISECNYGGVEGVQCITQQQLFKFTWIDSILQLLLNLKLSDYTHLNNIQTLNNIILWLLFNNNNQLQYINHAYRTLSYSLVVKIEEKLSLILLRCHQLKSKTLKKIIEITGRLNSELKDSHLILQSTRHILYNRLSKGAIHFISLLLTDNAALYAEMIGNEELSSIISALKEGTDSQSIILDQLTLDNTLSSLFALDKEGDVKVEIKNWSINSTGNNKSSLFSIPSTSSEFTISSASLAYVQRIVLGFLCVDNANKTNIFPHSVDCYAGEEKDKLTFLGTLSLVDDQHFVNYNTRVYGLNLNRLKNCDGSWIKSIRNKGLKYLKFKINKPSLVSVADILESGQKSVGYLNYSISFLTMEGYQEPKLSPSFSNLYINLLSILSYPEFKEGLKEFLKKETFKKKSGELLSALNKWLKVPQYQKQVINLMIAISEQSQECGDTILTSLIKESSQNQQFSVVIAEMIIKTPSLAPSRIQKFHHYILDLINASSTYAEIHLPIALYLQSLEITNYNMEKYNIPALTLPVEEKSIQSLLRIFSDLKPSEKHIIVQFFNCVFLMRGRISVENNAALRFVQKIWQLKHRIDFYYLIAAFVTLNKEISEWFFDNKHLKVVIQELLEGLDKNVDVTNEIFLLSALSYNSKINEEINKNTAQITIFKCLSDTKDLPTLLKNVGKEALKYFVEFFKNTCIDKPAESQFTGMLKDILGDLPNKYSIDFVYDFFIPLVNSYKSVPTILQPYSRDEKLYLLEPTKVLAQKPIKINLQKQQLIEKFLNSEVKSALNEIGNFWTLAHSSNDFPNKAKLLYIESENPVKNIVIYVDWENVTVVDGTLHHLKIDQSIILTPNIELKFTKTPAGAITFQHSGFESKPKLQAYKVVDKRHSLLVNQLLTDTVSSSIINHKYKGDNSPLQYITKQNLYLLPAEITVETLLSQINLSGLSISQETLSKFKLRHLLTDQVIPSTSLISDVYNPDSVVLKLEYDAEELFEFSSIENIVSRAKEFKPIVVTDVGLFRSFEKQGGVTKIIEVVIESISNWKNQVIAGKWLQLVHELKSFSSFPMFFSLYMQNKDNVQLLFNLLAALPDTEDPKKWEIREKQAMKFCYKALTQVLSSNVGSKVKESALGNNIMEVILERLHIISKQPKRQAVEQETPVEELPETPEIQRKISEEVEKKPKKKKGIGYGTDESSSAKWNKEEQEAAKKEIADQILSIMKIIILFIEGNNWVPPKSMVDSIYQSSLLPIIEAALRGGSLLEISKTAEIFQEYLKFIRVIATMPTLMPILLDVPSKYMPRQTQSIYALLKQLEGTNKIFLNVASNTTDAKDTYNIALKIIETYNIVNQAAQLIDNNQQQENLRILQLPLREKYPLLLQDLRFQYINMKDKSGAFKHHYSSYYSKGAIPPTTKMIRLAQEIADASTALPNQHTNAIFIRCDKERVDFMQALIMGPNGTPYGHGAFLFDIYFEDTYPETPPKVNLTTTGSGKVRFNPNLYSCGKVCLSLLGTWRGSASENWDPKVSTLLQVLISIQSIIMAEDVYFNEPGFEGEQGTVEGEKKNEAYANIVRLCNIKYAMIDNIKTPPKGFESIIRRHFYLKKNEILEEAQKWVKYAAKREASYTSLVSDHNGTWCKEFKKNNQRYKEMLEESIVELQTELNKLQPPSIKDLVKQDDQEEKQEVKNPTQTRAPEQDIEIDVLYNEKIEEKELNVDDEKVKDRWSRYIGAMGIDAVSRQSKANVLVFGCGSAALEIIKNLVLSGCKKLSIIDDKVVEWSDLSGNFFLSPADVGKPRAHACLHKIKELNFYVKVEVVDLKIQQSVEKLKQYHVVIATQLPQAQQILINTECHKLSIPFLSLDIYGPHSRFFNDFGESFEVLDKNGEDPKQLIIESISNEEYGVVTLLKGSKHPYEDGEVVVINKVEGMNLKEGEGSINQTTQKIRVINTRSFSIGDTRQYTEYTGSGIVKNIKLPVNVSFKSFDEVLKTKGDDIPVDQSLACYDFTKLSHSHMIHYSTRAINQFITKNNRLPSPWNYKDSDEFIEIYKQYDEAEFTPEKERFVRRYSFTAAGTFPPLQAFMGGFAAQQAIKAITKKYMPTNPLFYCDFNNVIQDLPQELSSWESHLNDQPYKSVNQRYEGLRIVIGDGLLQEIENCKVFMIGAGAIGCQLLKNYAMIELGAGKGAIHLTDPDHIEVSNLNRQFLFREKHLRKPKSATAAFSAIQMNERLAGHIHFRLDKVSEATKDIFSDKFFQEMSIATNALDNVQARRYVDIRCLENRIPLLESGTLGPKGHVQVIIPDLTETYGSKQDPVEEGEIPHCTLKMFPEETLHCVEWARDKFGQKFTLKPKALQKIIQSKGEYKPDASQIQSLRQSLRMIQKRPDNFRDCIHIAINKFYSYYRNAIKQLLYTYPLDFKNKDGQPFWKLPKRPPTAIEKFNEKDILHCTFVTSYAVMLAKIYDVIYPEDFRKDSRRLEIGKEAAEFVIEQFVPSDKKAQEISQQVSKQDKPQEKQSQVQQKQELDQFELVEKIQEDIKTKQITITPEQFDKDEDHLGHIDLIYSMANLRSINYCLEPMDWITTKLKAGRIVPALVTTTTSIAALQTYELVKYLKKVKITEMCNTFLNLAVPLVYMSEPGEAQKIKVHEGLTTNIWDRWEVEVSESTKLRDVFQTVEEKYGLKPRDLIVGTTPVYMSALMDLESKKEEKEKLLGSGIVDLVKQKSGYVDVTITFTLKEGGDLLKKLPKVRLSFKGTDK